ncbi:MAG: hypothetical protein H7239_04390 [Flavobacterium sp.]|nr:hypothetical protein [Flavobacterium sp.]
MAITNPNYIVIRHNVNESAFKDLTGVNANKSTKMELFPIENTLSPTFDVVVTVKYQLYKEKVVDEFGALTIEATFEISNFDNSIGEKGLLILNLKNITKHSEKIFKDKAPYVEIERLKHPDFEKMAEEIIKSIV